MASTLQDLTERLARCNDKITRLAARAASGDDGAIQQTRALTERAGELAAIIALPYVDPAVNNQSQMPDSSAVIRAAYPNSTGGDTPV